MAQSTLIAFVLVAAWLIFITAKGRLPAYMAVFGLTSGEAGGAPPVTQSPGDTTTSSSSPFGSGIGKTIWDILNTPLPLPPFLTGAK